MRIVMIGTGYVGLVSGACFSDFGHTVTCVDKDRSKIDALLNGEIPIFEPGLDELVAKNVAAGRLSFTLNLAEALPDADAVFIAVGTPTRRGDGHADLTYVYAAAEEMAPLLREGAVVVDKSTVPVGTGDEVEKIIARTAPDLKFSVASNPEFLREGAAIDDFARPDRIVVGVNDAHAEEVMEAIYRPLTSNGAPLIVMSRRAAELTKYAANAFLATKISFINEMADLCEKVGADVRDVAHGIGTDSRIGGRFLQPGPGYGGSCFPKDTLALLKTAELFDTRVSIVEAVVESNDRRKAAMGEKVIAALGGGSAGDLSGKTVAVLGLTFKADTDDMRDSPAIDIVRALTARGITVRAYDPEGMEQAQKHEGLGADDLTYCSTAYEAMEGAHAMVIVTEWKPFRALDLDRAKEALAAPVLVDLRNLYSRKDVEDHGFTYVAVGR
ncbi:nucleotide sugar dehydrogenase [Erythrobacter arachoides]|uniref:UDP-glucose 6-dehydrogenase n=1 Tax=Aurantiacibacter arachoides TaxID=1850444 RepID=A0A844ZZ50_9SPHN|nr:UDP-glucose/GDP-mannose dehydrogenase family protein [Aurantiacibacter arachoides]MXO92512.1 nucleotide sugar dehydrogenase [Aurantiacibacter arachoides]GGD56582.1 UDP-glucose 6-dehydrogenase [Aurantiacibacter arachoides]